MELVLVISIVLAITVCVFCDYRVCVGHNGARSGDNHCSVSVKDLDSITKLKLNKTGTTISVNSTMLSSRLNFDGMLNLTIEGAEDTEQSVVTCHHDNSGLYFNKIQGLLIRNVAFVGCGTLQNSTTTDLTSNGKNQTSKFKSTLYIWRSSNVVIKNVGIYHSDGIGLAIFNTNGTVIISNSTFRHNQVRIPINYPSPRLGGGGGVYIEFTLCPPGVLYGNCITPTNDYKTSSQYTIENCWFESNKASTPDAEKSSFVKLVGVKKLTNFQGLGRGGGLAVYILGSASENSISIMDCMFYKNQANSGGGLYIRIGGQSVNNSINVTGCEFVNNTSNQTGGGLRVGYLLSEIRGNRVSVRHCVMEGNLAKNGGGALLLMNNLGNCNGGENLVEFVDCKWRSNSAEYGAALDGIVYAPKGLGDNLVKFVTCNFSHNRVIETKSDKVLGIQTLSGRGTFKVTNMVITFCNSVHFENNTGTALWAVASKVHFSCTMTGLFLHNYGINGGAMSLVSNSIIFVHDNTTLKFVGNKAASRGGAIFSHSVHENSYLLSVSTCPLQYEGHNPMDIRNVSFIFEGNLATLDSKSDANNGNSIFITSLHSCVFFCTLNTSAELTVENYFSCTGKIYFEHCKNCTMDIDVATQGHSFTIDDPSTSMLYAIPGRVLKLPVSVLDDLRHAVDSVYKAQVINSSQIVIDPAYDYISNGKIKLYGPPLENGTLLIELAGLHEISLTVKMALLECPPGYYIEYKNIQVLTKQKKVQHCTCSWNGSSVSAYRGIICNQEASSAYVIHGYWAGYIENIASPRYFFTAFCPLHFCSYNNSNFKPYYLLPREASLSAVDEYMCGPARTGVLCAECSYGYSVYYHSKQFECKQNRLCKAGWLFYILSELCPITLMFMAIIFFNVSFTSGALNGFILFAQIIDSLALNAYDISEVYSPQLAPKLTEVYEFIYRIFNLEFFNIDSLSFCLWKGASTMDMLAFKLVSIFYGLILILVTILIIKRFSYRLMCLKKSKTESYIIHGLAAFLISCYIQCAQISFRILNPIYLKGVGSKWNEKLVQYSGNIKYFSVDHLPYALPALLVISTIIALPPLFLLWYPAGRKLLTLCRLNENKGVQFVEKILMIDRMKPLLDSFQSSFKDSCRLFAGLYFLYRILALTTFTLARTLPQFYVAFEIELVIIIAIHAAVQPYQRTWHNTVDAFIFSNIAIINALSMYIYIKATDLDQAAQEYISTAIVVRLLLIYLPLLYAVLYSATLMLKWLKIKLKQRKVSRESIILDNELPDRLLYPSEYIPFDRVTH